MSTPREQGGLAFKEGKRLTDNPYVRYTKEHDLWDEGWKDMRNSE